MGRHYADRATRLDLLDHHRQARRNAHEADADSDFETLIWYATSMLLPWHQLADEEWQIEIVPLFRNRRPRLRTKESNRRLDAIGFLIFDERCLCRRTE